MLRTTRWRPDTCGCIVTYQWDDTSPEDTRVHTLSQVESVCPIHTGLSDAQIYDELQKENQSKNKAIGEVVKLHKQTVEAEIRAELSGTAQRLVDKEVAAALEEIDKGADKIGWLFNPDRSLSVTLPAKLKTKKAELNAIGDALAKKVTFA